MLVTQRPANYVTPRFINWIDEAEDWVSLAFVVTCGLVPGLVVFRMLYWVVVWVNDHWDTLPNYDCSGGECVPPNRGFWHTLWNGRYIGLFLVVAAVVLGALSLLLQEVVRRHRRAGEARVLAEVERITAMARSAPYAVEELHVGGDRLTATVWELDALDASEHRIDLLLSQCFWLPGTGVKPTILCPKSYYAGDDFKLVLGDVVVVCSVENEHGLERYHSAEEQVAALRLRRLEIIRQYATEAYEKL